MSLTVKKQQYKCWNDCIPAGCPLHEASIEFQSVSDSIVLDNGQGQRFYMQTPELEAFMEMLRELAEERVEIKNALSTPTGEGEIK